MDNSEVQYTLVNKIPIVTIGPQDYALINGIWLRKVAAWGDSWLWCGPPTIVAPTETWDMVWNEWGLYDEPAE